jgi:PAS domain S-box-containing protein
MDGAAIAVEGPANQARSQNAQRRSESVNRRTLLIGLWVFVGYYLGAKLGFALTFRPHPVSVLWPPNAILVAALLLTPPRAWWVLFLAALPAHWIVQLEGDVPPTMIFCWYVSNCSEALIGAGAAWLLMGEPMRFNRLRNVGVFCLCVAFIGPFLSSFADSGFVVWNHFGKGSFWEIWRIRLISNVLAALTIAPLIVTWASDGRLLLYRLSLRRCVEGAVLFFLLVVISFMVLYRLDSGANEFLPYLSLPFLLWAAVRFGSPGASTAIGTVAFLTIWSAAHGHGPFSGGSPEQNAVSVQIFLIVLAVPILFLGTLMEELASGEIELRESEARFRTMADAAPVLIWMTGPDKLCTFFNKAWLEFTGRKMEQELGNGWTEGMHLEDFENCFQTYVTAFDKRKPFTMKYRLRRHDGEYRFVSDTGVPRYGVGGNFRGYVGACNDITDLLEQQKKLHEFEERVALAADAAHLGVWELNTATGELWISDKGRELFQFEREGPVSYADFQDRTHPEDRSIRDAALKQTIETKGSYEIEYRALLPGGVVRWISGRARYVPDENGDLTRILGVSMDVTERKQTQELLQIAAEGSHFGVWSWDEKTMEVVWDKAAREMFGVPPDAPITLDTFYNAIHPADLERVRTTWRRAVELRLPYQIEFRVERPTGAVRWIESRGVGDYDEAEKPLRMIGVVIDITERKNAEEQARKSRDEINRLSRVSLLGEMTASIAHELNQPLSGIMSNASAGQRFIDRGNVDLTNIREILVDIAADSRRAHDVIAHIRNTIKKGTEIRERINMNEVITRVSHMVQPDIVAHSCELALSLEKNLPTIEGDPIQIQQVLINLVTNACDAMRTTPTGQRKVNIATTKNGDGTIRVNVRDSGRGIADNVREHLFDQFFTTKEEGLGMGLFIVRSIIESHGGKISVENLNEGGACFYFTLPATMGANQ